MYASDRSCIISMVDAISCTSSSYILRAGFLDGREHFILVVMNAEISYYRYVKLWLKQKP